MSMMFHLVVSFFAELNKYYIWKVSSADVYERGHWKAYMKAYESAIGHTATKDAPWYWSRQTTNGSPASSWRPR